MSDSSDTSVSEHEATDEEHEDDGEQFLYMYGNEPEYTEEEMSAMAPLQTSSSGSEDEDDDDPDNRLTDINWCTCTKCILMPSLPESKCCQEFRELLQEKLVSSTSCITDHAHFEDICLKPHVLEACYIQQRRYKNRFTDVRNISNK